MPVLQEYSVILVIPDAASHSYLRAFSNLLLAKMGFKQLSLQQETLGATFGAGLSAACVVDVGATRTSIACVEDGTVISDTRCDTFPASPLNLDTGRLTDFSCDPSRTDNPWRTAATT